MVEMRTLGVLEVRGSDGRELSPVLAQPKRLALLVYLALARPRQFHRRDVIVALFWPQLDQDHARGALRVALRFLRRQLGENVIVSRTDEELGANTEALRCDALAFEQACGAGQLEEALALYRGDFLEGVFIADSSPDLERWMDTERARLRTCAARAAWQLTERHFDQRNPSLAADWARRAVGLSPDDEEAQRRLITLLDRVGDRAGAVHAYETFARRLAEDHEVEPSAETQALIRAIRLREDPSTSLALPPRPMPLVSSPTVGGASVESHDLLKRAVGRAKPLRHWIVTIAVAGGVGGLLIAATLLLVAHVDTRSSAIAPVTAKSIAVLPFVSLSSNPENEYLSDGMSEELIDALSKVGQLRVAARTSSFAFKGKNEDVRQIGSALNVRTVLSGSVRRVGKQLRVTAQLTDVLNGYVIWSDTYDRKMGDVFAVQDEITRAITNALKIKLEGRDTAGLVVPATQDLAAYSLYLKGRYYWHRRGRKGLERALEYFKQAVAKDSSYALAYAGLADVYGIMANWGYLASRDGYEKANAAALRSVALASGLAEAHTSLAWIKCYYEWDWPAAETEFRQAIELNPGVADAHFFYSLCLGMHRRPADALDEGIRAQQLDPLNPQIVIAVATAHYFAHRYDQAIAVLRKSQELEPDLASSRVLLAFNLFGSRRPAEALAEARKAQALADGSPIFTAFAGYAAARAGETAEARRVLGTLMQRPQGHAFAIACVYLGLGDSEQTFAWLNRAYDERSDWLALWALSPFFDPVRSDPRFAGLVKKIGLE